MKMSVTSAIEPGLTVSLIVELYVLKSENETAS